MKAHILIIEDDSAAMDLVVYLLKAAGCAVRTARTAEEAWADLEATGDSDRPDLVLCDLLLPQADGFELTRRLKASAALRTIPVVAISILTSWNHRAQALDAGCKGYIQKPISAPTFASEVEGFLEGPEQELALA